MDECIDFCLRDDGKVGVASRDVDGDPGAAGPLNADWQGRNQSERGRPAKPPPMMPPGRILLPVELTKCPLEVFSFVNQFAGNHRVQVILLHVVNLNVMVLENRLVKGLSCSAEAQLKRLAARFLSPRLSVRLQVRIGKPAEEILAEAKESNVDVIILSSYGGCSFWKRPFQPRIAEKVLRCAPCNATLLRVRTRFNCEEDWKCADDIVSALEYTGLLRIPMVLARSCAA